MRSWSTRASRSRATSWTCGRPGTTIRHADAAGLRYAQQTLSQLADAGSLPALSIVDHPDHRRRGYVLDISRDRVPTNDTLRWLVRTLAELRYNHLELYVEHTYAHAGHEVVWRHGSPLGPEDLRWLDPECLAHGIELVPNRNTFGHMERWLRHDRYRPLAECPEGAVSPFTGQTTPPTTLAPTPATAEFALGLVREMAAQVSSRLVNIGADEPFELGQGASAAAVAERGRAEVYLEHLDRLVLPLVAEGHHVVFWGDVLRRRPDLVSRLPAEGVTAAVWRYDAPAEDGGLLARQGAWRLAARAGLPGPTGDDLRDDLAEAVAHQRAAWAAESRPGGLDDSLRHLPSP
ncbi:MAG TPA: family 20 glycosylhydrolase [Acidimicrobiales bacterium]|nr:family 20 glycosylhydrolase [Acidimicrobiales bacterium]